MDCAKREASSPATALKASVDFDRDLCRNFPAVLIPWVREHTRIGETALRWQERGRADAMLLRGEELAAAKAWLAAKPKYAPDPTLLHHEFIKAAEDAEAARTSAERQR